MAWSELVRTDLMREITGTTSVNDGYEILVEKDSNSRKTIEARRKILNALAQGSAGFTELWKRAGVSSSTLHQWLPKLLEQQRVTSEGKLYHLNEQVPVPLDSASVSTALDHEPEGEPYPLVQVRRGHVELTRDGEDIFRLVARTERLDKGKAFTVNELANLINSLCWDGIRHKMVVDTTPLAVMAPRDPVTGEMLQRGAGNCPSCHTGMMKEIRPSSFWHCPNCGINRDGNFKPEALQGKAVGVQKGDE